MAIDRIIILDSVALGKKIVAWATDAATRPATFAAMKQALTDIVSFPSRITEISWVQPDLKTFVIRLPNDQMVKESIEEMQQNPNTTYPALTDYARKICQHDPSISNVDFLYTRIADYTIAQCK